MNYKKLCEVYEELEKNPGRLKKTEILSEFLKKLKDADREAMYLLQGRVWPDYEEKEFGVSSQLTIKALARSSGKPESEIVKRWKKIGDLGEVAAESIGKKSQSTLFSANLTTEKIIENLKKLPELKGKGTVDKKIGLIAELLAGASSTEAKYIIRTLLNDLRIGVGSGTIRDSIVWARFGREDRESYEIVQSAYDKSTDFAVVFEEALKGKASLIKTKFSPGQPLKVMLALKAENIADGFERAGKPCAIEFKYDGFRCITGYTQLYTKDKGFLSARHIKKGDYLLSHKGRFKKVLEINKRKIDKNERLVELQSFYGSKVRISEKHPILVYRKKPEWVNIEYITKKDKLLFPIPKIDIDFPYKKQLILKDESGYSKTIKLNDFFFRFLGYWIGDGFTNDFHNTERVGLIFNLKSEKKLSEYYEENIKKIFKIENISRNIHNGAIYLYWRDKPLRLWLSKYFRREWKGKALPNWFMGINKKQLDNFLLGWAESDGYTDEFNRTSITTKERDLAMFASLLGLKFKKMIGISKFRINKKDYYRLIIPKSNRGFSVLNEKYFLIDILRINQVKKPHPYTTLYNFQIEGDESYCGSMIALHNCLINKDEKGNVKIFTRRLDEVTNQFPEIKELAKKYVNAKNFILDSEAVGYNPKTKKYLPFQSISQRIKRKYNIEEMAKKFPVEINVFDILYYNSKPMIEKPFKERTELLRKIIKEEKWKFVAARQVITSDEKEAEKFYKKALEEGEEGVMIKNLQSPYKPGARIGYMLKLKPASNEFDLAITGAEYGTGKRGGWLTSFDIACRDSNTGELLGIGKVSTGIKEKSGEGTSYEDITKILKPLITKEEGRAVKVKPKIVITVVYQNIQKSPSYDSGFALRFPRFTALRTDRDISDIASLKDIKREARKKTAR